MIEFATLNRFNNLLVQVRGRGDAYYKSNLVPKSNLIQDIDFDPLAYLIPLAQEKGIRVHAWVNTYLLWSSRVMPVQKNHVLKSNPNWIDQNINKKINISVEMKKFNGGKNGIEGFEKFKKDDFDLWVSHAADLNSELKRFHLNGNDSGKLINEAMNIIKGEKKKF